MDAPRPLPPRDEMVAAMLACDAAYEGVFITAVRTTGIYCRPTCTARKPLPRNVDFYPTCAEAAAARGFPTWTKSIQRGTTLMSYIRQRA